MRIVQRALGVFACVSLLTLAGVTGSAAGAAPSKAATGTPIKIGGFYEVSVPPGQAPFPESAAAAKGAVAKINKKGGVNGHPIDLTVCDTKADANVAASCARDMVANKVMAIVNAGRFAVSWMPITSAAGIPFIGYPSGSIEVQDSSAYNTTAGNFGNTGGAAAVAADIAKTKSLVVAHADTPTAAASITAIDPILATRGISPSKKLPIPIGAVDEAPYAATIISGGYDTVYMGMTSADADKLTLALRQAGSKIKIVRSSATFPLESIQTLGANADGVLVASQWKSVASTSDRDVKKFLKQLRSIDKNVTANAIAMGSWSAVYTFADAAKQATNMDAASLRAVLDSGKSFAAPGLSGLVQFKTPNVAIGLPRVFNVLQTYTVVKKGKLVTANNNAFVDPYVVPKKKGSK